MEDVTALTGVVTPLTLLPISYLFPVVSSRTPMQSSPMEQKEDVHG